MSILAFGLRASSFFRHSALVLRHFSRSRRRHPLRAEATHGTAPKYANQDKVNPGSVILSGEMMFRYMGWSEAADLILKGLKSAIASKRVTYDFARLMEGATEIKCSEFGNNVIDHM